ncbi:hypothetical protein F4821DRAFT_216331 [Hypoxylon rubiginosum]|uniref:Uncharacterized protein n=1 Tax=Hypoxylon rubiginosum TaxID=110542 RepID=A0ACC0CPV2_9PEZI|nr:hypothetical protein F4821DRAFT_216331 [Hypoxylon rubiginosum]
MDEQWGVHEATIRALYTRNSLPEVRKIMIDQYGFKASISTYYSKFIEWGLGTLIYSLHHAYQNYSEEFATDDFLADLPSQDPELDALFAEHIAAPEQDQTEFIRLFIRTIQASSYNFGEQHEGNYMLMSSAGYIAGILLWKYLDYARSQSIRDNSQSVSLGIDDTKNPEFGSDPSDDENKPRVTHITHMTLLRTYLFRA